MSALEPARMIRRILIIEGPSHAGMAVRGALVHPSVAVEVVAAGGRLLERAREMRPHLIVLAATHANAEILADLRRDAVLRFVRAIPIAEEAHADTSLRDRVLKALGLVSESGIEAIAMRTPVQTPDPDA